MREIRLKINDESDRENLVLALAKNGYDVRVERDGSTVTSSYFIVFKESNE